ncbi:large subunit ribosomal protein L18e [Nematocida sp. LUAm3]|nr:large subunit ribosomal protein L18e [Nematocida sp. LUAm3]KAI5175159.1 large subunit ribosomal protein L18e [Nematocida sp. LUAm2]KAI5178169.1 large subunit ribosomal protein L18e [Nematocida sp. LUAm1]
MLGRTVKPRSGRKTPTTQNEEVQALFKLFSTVARKTTHMEYRKIAEGIKKPRTQRPVVTLNRLVEEMENYKEKIAVVTAKVVGDDTVVIIPYPIKLACLDISRQAKEKIEKYGGQVYKLDELFRVSPTPKDMILINGSVTARKSYKYFGVPGDRHNPAKPRTLSKRAEKTKRKASQCHQ